MGKEKHTNLPRFFFSSHHFHRYTVQAVGVIVQGVHRHRQGLRSGLAIKETQGVTWIAARPVGWHTRRKGE